MEDQSSLEQEEECGGSNDQEWAAKDSIVTDVLVEAIFICGKYIKAKR